MDTAVLDIQILNDLLSVEFARCKRYDTPVAIAILHAKAPNIFDEIGKNIRDSDYFQYLGSDLYGIIYTHTDIDGAEIAIERIIDLCDSLCPNAFHIGLVEIESGDESEYNTTSRLLHALHEANDERKKIAVHKTRKEPGILKKFKFMKWWR